MSENVIATLIASAILLSLLLWGLLLLSLCPACFRLLRHGAHSARANLRSRVEHPQRVA